MISDSLNETSSKPIDINIRASAVQFLSLPEDEKDPNKTKDQLLTLEKIQSQQVSVVEVPAGMAIIGDPFSDNLQNERPAKEVELSAFSIGVYPVTNGQYAHWLNQAVQSKTVYMGNGNQTGLFYNKENQLLCKTMEANQLSQLSALKTDEDIQIISLPGKENYPVIEVTWYGAQAYCQDNKYRLPTESEWEKAAGMSLPTINEKPKRFKFGFAEDTIDRTWANYRDSSVPSDFSKVLTTPVGFYNGINTLPLTAQDHTLMKTKNAKSPAGAYDMSGNVWEWVDTNVAKGGCYDSLAQGVRVGERLQLPREHSDIFTGFRVAK